MSADGNTSDYDLEALRAHAATRGGECTSERFEGRTAKHTWRCGRAHEFEASPVLLIEGGYWCPRCMPSVEDPSDWDYEVQSQHDPALRKLRERR